MFDCYKALQSIEAMCKDMAQHDAVAVEENGPEAASVSPSSPTASLPASTASGSFLRADSPVRASSSPGRQQESSASGVRPARTVFSAWQLAELEREYGSSRYLSSAQRRQLSSRLRLSEPTVKVWFQNRRMKEKRQHSESQVHYLNQLMQSYMLQLQCASGLAPVPPAAPLHQLLSPQQSSPVGPSSPDSIKYLTSPAANFPTPESSPLRFLPGSHQPTTQTMVPIVSAAASSPLSLRAAESVGPVTLKRRSPLFRPYAL